DQGVQPLRGRLHLQAVAHALVRLVAVERPLADQQEGHEQDQHRTGHQQRQAPADESGSVGSRQVPPPVDSGLSNVQMMQTNHNAVKQRLVKAAETARSARTPETTKAGLEAGLCLELVGGAGIEPATLAV